MELFEAIAKRHSYRGPFTAAKIPRANLERIVNAGLQAPSGCNQQTTTFVIVDDPALIASIAAIVDKQVVREAKAIVVCVMQVKVCYKDKSFGVEDCAAAVENMLLAVTALGYATVWLDGAIREEGRAQKIGALLGVPEDRTVRVILPIGVPAETRAQPPKAPFGERAWFNRWQAQ